MEMYGALVDQLSGLRAEMLKREADLAPWVRGVDASYRASARNLAHYLALRQCDRRPLQDKLDSLGLCSLGSTESSVLANVDKVLDILHRLSRDSRPNPGKNALTSSQIGRNVLEQHTEALLGHQPERTVRIMVTLPSEAASDFGLVRQLVESGMDVARINCAHDAPIAWQKMAVNVRRAATQTGRSIRVLMDLGGPKLRTGPIAPGPAILKLRPLRDSFGVVTASTLVGLRPAGSTTQTAGAVAYLGVNAKWVARLEPGDHLDFTDASGSGRSLRVLTRENDCCLAECSKTARLTLQTRIQRRHKGKGKRNTSLSDLPQTEGVIHLVRGSLLRLTRDGIGAIAGGNCSIPTVACTLPLVFEQVRVGERIWFDDGRIGGVIRNIDPHWLQIEITHARDGGEKLRGDKGINLPDSQLDLPAMTEKDIEDLAVVVRLADLVGLSFVHRSDDVKSLRSHLHALGKSDIGIMLKIETRQGFENLPELMFAAMASCSAGVMIARGDLAVECGYERLAEVQEEILWAAEAAHMPVVWATQVLETLAKTGLPTRAEITDAAMAERAECVMLNKGPYIGEAMYTLNDILCRMQHHQTKRQPRLRALHAWIATPASSGAASGCTFATSRRALNTLLRH